MALRSIASVSLDVAVGDRARPAPGGSEPRRREAPRPADPLHMHALAAGRSLERTTPGSSRSRWERSTRTTAAASRPRAHASPMRSDVLVTDDRPSLVRAGAHKPRALGTASCERNRSAC